MLDFNHGVVSVIWPCTTEKALKKVKNIVQSFLAHCVAMFLELPALGAS